MLEFTFKDKQNNSSIPVQVPVHWGEVKVGQYIDVISISGEYRRDERNARILSALTGVSLDIIYRTQTAAIYNLFEVISFMFSDEGLKGIKLPIKYNLGSKEIDIPTDLGALEFGQQRVFQNLIPQDMNVHPVMDKAIAVYVQCNYTNEDFDEKRHPEIINLVRESLLIEALPILDFFLRRYVRLSKPKEIHLNLAPTPTSLSRE